MNTSAERPKRDVNETNEAETWLEVVTDRAMQSQEASALAMKVMSPECWVGKSTKPLYYFPEGRLIRTTYTYALPKESGNQKSYTLFEDELQDGASKLHTRGVEVTRWLTGEDGLQQQDSNTYKDEGLMQNEILSNGNNTSEVLREAQETLYALATDPDTVIEFANYLQALNEIEQLTRATPGDS